MSNIDFPNTPNNGDTYSFDGKQWTFDGEKWETSGGSKGQKGEPGPGAGDKGAKGEPGVGGSTGPSGTKGEKGESGPQGAVGPQGSSGAQGVAGPTGPQGVAGGTFVGAKASPSAQLDTTATYQTVPLNSVDYDTSSFISSNAFVIPANSSISYVEINADLESLERASYYPTSIRIQKNGTTILEDSGNSGTYDRRNLRLNTGVIQATANDSFVVQAKSGGNDGAVGANSVISIHATVTGTTAQGDKGAKGDTGSAGPQGPQGDAGPVGPAGATGDKGDTGACGSQTLTLNSTAGQLAISGGNNVDLRQTQYLYSSTSDLPSASTYHGAIAHVHSEGALYFAHGGSWNKLANDSTAVNSSSEVTFTRDVHFQRGVEERFGSLSGQSGTVTHNLNDGHVFYHTTPAGDFTANFTNFNLDDGYTTSITIIVNQGVTARVVSAVQIEGSAQTINWQGGSAPTGTANGLDAFSFTILRNSSSYIVLGQMVDFA